MTEDTTGQSARKKQFWAELGLLLVAMIWGSAFVFSKKAVMEMAPMSLMAVRFVTAFVVSAVFFHKKLKGIPRGELRAGVIIGVFLFAAYATQMSALPYIGAGRQAFETGTYVVLVPFIYFLVTHRRPDRYNLAATFIMLAGMACLSLVPGEGANWNVGDTLTMLCAVLFAAQIVANGIFARGYDPVVLTVVQLGTSAVLSVISCVLTRAPFTGISPGGWFSALYVGFFSTFVCALLQTVCQKYTSETRAAMLMCLETVFGCIASFFMLGERFTPLMLFGFVLIFLAIVISETKLSFLSAKTKREKA